MQNDFENVVDRKAAEKEKPKTRRPQMHNVILLNDDFTPMEFVVSILREEFNHSAYKAENIMMEVHKTGRGVCGTYTLDEAQTRVEVVHEKARAEGHPLMAVHEPVPPS